MKYCFPLLFREKIKNNDNKVSLQVFDEFALAITIFEALGITVERPKEMWVKSNFYGLGVVKITSVIKEFIDKNIKKEYQSEFELLISDPVMYITRLSDSSNYLNLYDMIKFN